MFYTRLSMNFQPKTAQPPRRWFLSAGLAAWASCYAGGMMSPLASVRSKNPRCFNRAKYNSSPANDPAGD